ncbi:MAG: hypothetical protein AAB885_03715 [Patescibacteria group bacterium]
MPIDRKRVDKAYVVYERATSQLAETVSIFLSRCSDKMFSKKEIMDEIKDSLTWQCLFSDFHGTEFVSLGIRPSEIMSAVLAKLLVRGSIISRTIRGSEYYGIRNTG